MAQATAARDFAALRALLNAAVEAELIARSPLRGVRLATPGPPARPTLTPGQLASLAAAIDPRFRTLVLLGGWLGLRWSEAIALRVSDVDLDRWTLSISRTLSEVGGRLELDETKSRSSRRTLALPGFLVEEIVEHLAKHRTSAASTNLLFVGRHGAPLRRSFAARHFGPAVSAAGLDPRLTFHGLRHVATSFMVDAGEHPRVMQARLGHASARLTMELYAHVSDDTDRFAAARLDAMAQSTGAGPLRPTAARPSLDVASERSVRQQGTVERASQRALASKDRESALPTFNLL